MLLPAQLLPRRRDEARVVGRALLAHAAGVGHRRIAARLGLPASTVRGWLRSARANAERLRVLGTVTYYRFEPTAGPIAPAGTALADAVEALARAARAVSLRSGPGTAPWATVNSLTAGRLLRS